MSSCVRLLTVGCAAALVLPATAAAQTPGLTVTLDPPKAKQGSTLKLVLDGAGLGDTGGRPPTSIRLLTQAGFAFDARAVKGRCTPGATSCRADAKIGSGSAQAAYSFIGLTGTTTASAEAFLTEPQQAGDLAGVVVVADIPELGRKLSFNGRVLRAAAPSEAGLELRFDGLLSGAGIPAGVSVTLQRLTIEAGAARTTTKTRTVRRRGKRVKVKVKTKRSLITNPKRCSGAWTARGIVTLGNGGERTLPVRVPCRR